MKPLALLAVSIPALFLGACASSSRPVLPPPDTPAMGSQLADAFAGEWTSAEHNRTWRITRLPEFRWAVYVEERALGDADAAPTAQWVWIVRPEDEFYYLRHWRITRPEVYAGMGDRAQQLASFSMYDLREEHGCGILGTYDGATFSGATRSDQCTLERDWSVVRLQGNQLELHGESDIVLTRP